MQMPGLKQAWREWRPLKISERKCNFGAAITCIYGARECFSYAYFPGMQKCGSLGPKILVVLGWAASPGLTDNDS